MYYVKTADTERPLLGNRAGGVVVEGDKECPYAGCYANAKITMWSYANESNGVNANIRSVQFVEDGAGFGGGGARNAEDEFEAIGDSPSSASAGGKDPFDL
jgi:hypothetical protein